MYCIQCGSKIEDGFKFCPECGVRINPSAEVKNRDIQDAAQGNGYRLVRNDKTEDHIARTLFLKYPTNRSKAIKKLCGDLRIDLDSASKIMDRQYSAPENQRIIQEYTQAAEEMSQKISDCVNYAMCQRSMKKAEKRANKHQVHCPRCKSTSISYGQKPSWGRALVGYGVAGDAGAVIGSMTGKNGYAVCMKCGKRWKI